MDGPDLIVPEGPTTLSCRIRRDTLCVGAPSDRHTHTHNAHVEIIIDRRRPVFRSLAGYLESEETAEGDGGGGGVVQQGGI